MPALTSLLTIGAEIGRGHYGVVFEGDDPVHRKVAVKVIFRDPNKPEADWLNRKIGLLNEAQHLKKAGHRNVVPVYHLCATDDGQAMLYVMAFCEGGCLQAPYKNGPIDIAKLRHIATDVSAGLEALHARGMIHRDIKPANLLIDGKGCVKLGDFGLVTDELILGYAAAAGYTDHLAPEIWEGKNCSVRSDIWALGMTFFRLLHGQIWYEQMEPPREIVKDGGFSDTLKWLPHVPKDWRRTIRAMLRDDPNGRYKTATEVMNALSSLSIEPSWKCIVTNESIQWERIKGTRKISVEWDLSNPKKTTWRAWSDPLGNGRSRALGQSSKPLARKTSEKELRNFFEDQS